MDMSGKQNVVAGGASCGSAICPTSSFIYFQVFLDISSSQAFLESTISWEERSRALSQKESFFVLVCKEMATPDDPDDFFLTNPEGSFPFTSSAGDDNCNGYGNGSGNGNGIDDLPVCLNLGCRLGLSIIPEALRH